MSELNKNNEGMKVPEGYFDNVQTNVLKQLSKSPNDGLTIPENYFDDMQKQVVSSLKPKSRMRFLRPMSIAASFTHITWMYMVSK